MKISFSYNVREEITAELPESDCCKETLLASVLFHQMSYDESSLNFFVKVSSHKSARLIYQLLKRISQQQIKWKQLQEKYLKKRKIFIIYIPQCRQMDDFLADWGIKEKFKKSRLKNICCKKAFIKGAFLVSGSISNPGRFYHFEIVCSSQVKSSLVEWTLGKLGITAKTTCRKNHEVVYVKKSDHIALLLSMLGAYRNLFKFEEIRAIKETKEDVRRRVNCETANLEKSAEASVRINMKIRKLQQAGILCKLSKELRETADLRIRYPEASLRELAEKFSPPLSKSTVNSRLRRLEAIDMIRNNL